MSQTKKPTKAKAPAKASAKADTDELPSDAELMKLLADTSAWEKATGKPGQKFMVKSSALQLPKGAKAFTPIPVMPLGNGLWRLDRDTQYADAVLGCTLFARKGYEFDLASVPRAIWPIIAPFELSILAPLFHDLIYEFRGQLPAENVTPFRNFTRQDADDLFYRLMAAEEVSRWKRALAYTAVRSAGWAYWNT
jgi:hypothetical protein